MHISFYPVVKAMYSFELLKERSLQCTYSEIEYDLMLRISGNSKTCSNPSLPEIPRSLSLLLNINEVISEPGKIED